jgi:hypothetical protein
MNEAGFRKELGELRETLMNSPKSGRSAKDAADSLYLSSAESAGRSLRDTLDQLRVLLKYVVFDLEATRRENHYLRRMLETRSQRDREEGTEDEST